MTVLTHTHQGVGTISGASLTLTVTTTVNIPIGDTAFGVIGYHLAGGLSTITCADNATGAGAVNTWTLDQSQVNAGSSGELYVFRTNVTRAIAPGRTVTFTWGTSNSAQRAGGVVFSTHGWTVTPSVQFAAGSTGGPSGSLSTSSVGPTTAADSFVLTAYGFKGALAAPTYTETSGKTAGTRAYGAAGTTGGGCDYSWTETSVTGTQSGSATLSPASTQGWTAIILVYTAAAGTLFTKSITGSAQFAGVRPKVAMSTTRVGVLSFSGAEVSHPTARLVAGGFAPSGVLARQLSLFRTLTGALSFSGARTAATAYARSLVGAVFTPTGVNTRVKAVSKAVSGALSFVGASTRLPAKVLTGTFTPSGALNRVLSLARTVTGALSFAGSVKRSTSHKLVASAQYVGMVITSQGATHLTAIFRPTGAPVTHGLPARTLFAGLQITTSLARLTSRQLVSSLVAAGVIHTQYLPPTPPPFPGGGGFGAVMSDSFFQRYKVDGKWRGVKRVRA